MNQKRDLDDLFLSCRKGDLIQVQYLVQEKEVDLNVRDQWDSTPLYYACLCGHKEVVEYLLASGARCEANTFDGERCVYGALDDVIRQILLNYKVVTSHTMRRNLYDEFLRRLLEGVHSDVTFIVHGTKFHVHKCILSARSSYFCSKFEGRWKNRKIIDTSHQLINHNAFKSLIQFLYTGRLETNINDVDIVLRLANQCLLPKLKTELEDQLKKVTAFESSKPNLCNKVKTLTIESPELVSDLAQDLGVLAVQAVPPALRDWVGADDLPLLPSAPLHLVDVCFVVDGHTFLCHKVFFALRSEYFKALLADHFCEAEQSSDGMSRIHVRGVHPQVFAAIVHYVYTNQVITELPERLLLELLTTADMYLLPGLQRACGQVLANRLSVLNVLTQLRLARFFNLQQLENQCYSFIASHIEKMKDMPELQELILQDADEVEGRQETDTIPIIDDIRYHVTLAVQDMSSMSEAQDKLRIIDDLLEELGLDA